MSAIPAPGSRGRMRSLKHFSERLQTIICVGCKGTQSVLITGHNLEVKFSGS